MSNIFAISFSSTICLVFIFDGKLDANLSLLYFIPQLSKKEAIMKGNVIVIPSYPACGRHDAANPICYRRYIFHI